MAPLLNLNEKTGELYESDSTRSDGMGYSRGAYAATQKDVYLDNASVFAEEKRKEQRANRKYYDKRMAELNRHRKKFIAKKKKEEAKRARIAKIDFEKKKAANMGQDPRLEKALVQSSQNREYESVGISGYGFSADGRPDHDRLAGASMGRSADYDYAETESSAPFSATDTVPAVDFGGFPSLSDFISPSISALSQNIASRIAPSPPPPPLPAQPPQPSPAVVAAAKEREFESVLAAQNAIEQKRAEREAAQTKQYMMYGAIGLGVILITGLGLTLIKRK